MAVKKSNIISIALLLTLAITPLSSSLADGDNSLVQLDLKKSSNNSVNVTLFTTNSYNDNVMVRKKSDNKYVILIPKVQSKGFSNTNFNGVKDLISNVDVKTVDDTSGGYTKVTLITTKPLDIKTSALKSSPITAEQKEYKNLIAQANSIKKTVNKQEIKVQPSKQKTSINKTVNEKVVTKKSIPNVSNISKKITNDKVVPNINKKDLSQNNVTKPNIKLKEVSPNERLERKVQLAKLIEEVKQEKMETKVPDKQISQEKTSAVTSKLPNVIKDVREIKNVNKNNSIFSKIVQKTKNSKKAIGISILSLFGLMMISKLIKASAKKAREIQETFIDQLAKQPPILNTVKYNSITNNENLSWQEKYKLYLDASAKPVPRANKKGNYLFIKKPVLPNNQIEQKRAELEKIVSEVSNTNTQKDIQFDNSMFENNEVQNEDESIHKTIKFKAFDHHQNSLNLSDRGNLKSRFKKYEKEIPLHEQKNIELGKSLLHTNPRKLRDGNLNIEDVSQSSRIKFSPSEYIMSSVEEFFAIPDSEEQIQKVETPEVTKITTREEKVKKQTNPITSLRNETKHSYLNNLIIKSGFNIDDKKGFYVVSLDGKSALVGKVNEEVFVLKQFDKNVTDPIQVRHDNANVYMVKAGNFKSLVEVNDEKMGVLIEL